MSTEVEFGFVAAAAGEPGASDAQLYRDLLADCEHAAQLGFHSVWMIEHHFSDYFPTPNPLILLSHAAARFPDFALGTCVLVAPWHNPLRLAEDIAALSALTDRPLHLGLGRGTAKYEYDAFGIDMADSRDLFREAYEIITSALSGQQFTYHGQHLRVPKAVRLRPDVDTSRVHFYGAIGTPGSATIMADLGLPPICTSIGDFETQAATVQAWKESASRHGLSTDVTIPLMINCIIADTDDEAVAEAQRYIPAFMQAQIDHYTPDETNWQTLPSYSGWKGAFESLKGKTKPESIPGWAQWQLIGSPDTVREKTRKLQDAGFTHIALHTATPGVPAEIRRQWLARFAAEVAPAFAQGARP